MDCFLQLKSMIQIVRLQVKRDLKVILLPISSSSLSSSSIGSPWSRLTVSSSRMSSVRIYSSSTISWVWCYIERITISDLRVPWRRMVKDYLVVFWHGISASKELLEKEKKTTTANFLGRIALAQQIHISPDDPLSLPCFTIHWRTIQWPSSKAFLLVHRVLMLSNPIIVNNDVHLYIDVESFTPISEYSYTFVDD